MTVPEKGPMGLYGGKQERQCFHNALLVRSETLNNPSISYTHPLLSSLVRFLGIFAGWRVWDFFLVILAVVFSISQPLYNHQGGWWEPKAALELCRIQHSPGTVLKAIANPCYRHPVASLKVHFERLNLVGQVAQYNSEDVFSCLDLSIRKEGFYWSFSEVKQAQCFHWRQTSMPPCPPVCLLPLAALWKASNAPNSGILMQSRAVYLFTVQHRNLFWGCLSFRIQVRGMLHCDLSLFLTQLDAFQGWRASVLWTALDSSDSHTESQRASLLSEVLFPGGQTHLHPGSACFVLNPL